MEYNKNHFQKMNDKKVLHKVRKHWVVVSLAMLMALGGTAAATHVSANADSTTSNSNDQSSTQTPKETQSQSLVKSANQNASAQNNNQAQLQSNNQSNGKSTVKAVTNAASQLHQHILNNAVSNKPVVPKVGAQQTPANNNQAAVNQNQRQLGLTNHYASAHQLGAGAPATGNSTTGSKATSDKPDSGHLVPNYHVDTTDPLSRMNIHYLNTAKHGADVMDEHTSDTAGNTKFYRSYYLENTPTGFQLDKSVSGYDYSDNYPSQYDAGNHDLTIYVKPVSTTGSGSVTVNFMNGTKDVNTQSYSDSVSDKFSVDQLQSLIGTPPVGYQYDGSYSINGGSDKTSTTGFNLLYGNGAAGGNAVLNINVTPISNPNSDMVEGTVTYEDDTDGDSYVSSTTFKKQQTGSDLTDLKQYTANVPAGYTVDDSKPAIQDKYWENGDNDIIFVKPNKTKTTPKAQAHHSFVTANYVTSTGKLINQINLTGSDSTSVGETFSDLVPANYHKVSSTNAVTNFPSTDGATATQTITVALNNSDNPESKAYKASDAQKNKYASTNIVYVDINAKPSDANAKVGSDIPLDNYPAGTVINYAPYILNVPSKYQFVSMGAHEGTIENNFNNHSNVTGVEPNANIIYVEQIHTSDQPIYVKYYDQNGNQVGTEQQAQKGALGVPVDVTIGTDGSSTVPKGYHVLAGENTTYTVTNNIQHESVLVAGDNATGSEKVPSNTTNSNGTVTHTSDNTSDVAVITIPRTLNINGTNYSDPYTEVLHNPVASQQAKFTANDIVPKGFTADSVQPDQKIVFEVTPSDSLTATKYTADPIKGNANNLKASDVKLSAIPPFTYSEIPATSKHKVNSDAYAANYMPIEVKFFNQQGVQVADKNGQPDNSDLANNKPSVTFTYSDAMAHGYVKNTSDGAFINVVNPGLSNKLSDSLVPSGYHLSSRNPSAEVTYKFEDPTSPSDKDEEADVALSGDLVTDSNTNQSDSNPTVTSTPKTTLSNGTTTLPAVGQHLHNNQILVHRIMHSVTGDTSDNVVVSVNGHTGDKDTITASDAMGKSLVPAGFNTDSSVDPAYPVTIGQNGVLSGIPHNKITYNFDKQTAYMNIQYVDAQQNGNPVGPVISVKGEIGTQPDMDYYLNNDNIDNYMQQHGVQNAAFTSGYYPVGNRYYEETKTGDTSTSGKVPTFGSLTNSDTFQIELGDRGSVNVVYKDATPGSKYGQQVGPTKVLVQPTTGLGSNGAFNGVPTSDTNMVPNGYTYDSSLNDTQNGITNGINMNGVSQYLVGSPNNTVYVYVTEDPTTPIETNLSTVKVHYVDADNHAKQIGELNLSNKPSANFSDGNDLTSTFVPNGYETDGTGLHDGNGNVVTTPTNYPQSNEEDLYVYVNRLTSGNKGPQKSPDNSSSIPTWSTDTIQYYKYDTKNGDVSSSPISGMTSTITGKTNEPIDYSTINSFLPSGYKVVGLKSGTADYEPNGVEQMLVSQPEPEYGKVTVNYYSSDGKGNDTLVPSDTNVVMGKNGSSFDMSNFEYTLPYESDFSYNFDHANVDGNPQNQFLDYYTTDPHTVNIYMTEQKPIPSHSTITVNYIDANSSNPNHRDTVTETTVGKTNTPFDALTFEQDMPAGGSFDGIQGQLPTVFPKYDSTNPGDAKHGYNYQNGYPTTLNILVNYNGGQD